MMAGDKTVLGVTPELEEQVNAGLSKGLVVAHGSENFYNLAKQLGVEIGADAPSSEHKVEPLLTHGLDI